MLLVLIYIHLNSSLESIKIKTLWTNTELDDTSNLSYFNPQTIEINGISEYDIIGICHSSYDKAIARFNFILNIPYKYQIIDVTYSDETTGYQFCGYNRRFTILENGISFEDGYNSSVSSIYQNNAYAIPIKIIGIKL